MWMIAVALGVGLFLLVIVVRATLSKAANLGQVVEEADSDEPDRAAALHTFAANSLKEGRLARAIDCYSRLIDQNPDDVKAWNMRGMVKGKNGDLEGALLDFTRAIELAPTNPNFLVNRAGAHAELNDHAKAIVDLDRAIGMNESLAVAFADRGLAHTALGHDDAAVKDLERYLELAPDAPDAAQARAALANLRVAAPVMDDELREAARRGAMQVPVRMRELIAEGTEHLQEGRLAEAREALEKAYERAARIQDARHGALAKHRLAVCAFREGDLDGAEAQFEEALAMRRDVGDIAGQADSVNQLAVIHLHRRQPDQARARLEELMSLDQRQGNAQGIAMTLAQLGGLALQEGDLVRASERLREARGQIRSLGIALLEGEILHNVAMVAARRDRHPVAVALMGLSAKLGADNGASDALQTAALWQKMATETGLGSRAQVLVSDAVDAFARDGAEQLVDEALRA